MDLNKKYFGMTVMQLGILGGLGAMAMLLFCIVGVLVAKNGFGGAAAQQLPTSSPTIAPTATLILTPTQTSTPTLTPVPYEALITPGWVQQRTALFELWLPTGYKAAKPDNLITGLADTSIIDFSVRGTLNSKSPNKIYVTVSYEPLPEGTLEDFINQHVSSQGAYLSLSDRSHVNLNNTPAVRLVFSGRKGNIDVNELTYIVLDGSTVWYVQYTAVLTEFFDLLPMFEASAETFRLVR